MVADLGASFPTELTPVGARLYFAATSTDLGTEIWVVEPSGQVGLVGDIAPGVFSSVPRELTVAGDTLFFTADDGSRGREPWALKLGGFDAGDPPLPNGPFLTDPEVPGFRFKVRISTPSGDRMGERKADYIPETLCVSGAIPGRSELFLRVVGTKPNGKLWPTLVRFSTSTIDVWITQSSTGVERHYRLEGATPGSSDLSGLFDRSGFEP